MDTIWTIIYQITHCVIENKLCSSAEMKRLLEMAKRSEIVSSVIRIQNNFVIRKKTRGFGDRNLANSMGFRSKKFKFFRFEEGEESGHFGSLKIQPISNSEFLLSKCPIFDWFFIKFKHRFNLINKRVLYSRGRGAQNLQFHLKRIKFSIFQLELIYG